MELNFGVLECKNEIYQRTDRVQRVDEKDGITFIIFPSRILQYGH